MASVTSFSIRFSSTDSKFVNLFCFNLGRQDESNPTKMIFGVGTGEIILCASLAHRVWKKSRDVPNDFQNVSTEVASFKLVFDEERQSIVEREIDHRLYALLSMTEKFTRFLGLISYSTWRILM